MIEESKLYMPSITPALGNLNTSMVVGSLPSAGVKVMVKVPACLGTKSVALY